MFYDQARIYVRSGDGGDGHISFRREKFVSMGGPDGGHGGRGGDITFYVDNHLNSLSRYRRNVHFKAGDGTHGGTRNKTGANGESLSLPVPPGTLIRDEATGQLLADLTEENQQAIVLTGGRGGRGNSTFANSVRQAPSVAERGEEGEERWLLLELKLIADVGIVGVPNAGKSTLLSVVSSARPKIADYPFTTLQPNLGVVELDDFETMVLADIPGLIEGAAGGAGLGHEFLRHVERTRVLIHLLDGDAKDPLEDWAMINQELAEYDAPLDTKPQIVVLNKIDTVDGQAWAPLIEERIKVEGYEFAAISAITGQGVRDMLYKVKQMLEALPEPEPVDETIVVIQPQTDERDFTIEVLPDGYRVHGKQIERVAAMTYWEFEATVIRFQRILDRSGISDALMKAGVKPGDSVFIGEMELEWSDA
ncbi:MAG: GTPase ObgE [Anaerolineales bacterium]|nr:GTPase ObgE [Anaerolineales bacterium]